ASVLARTARTAHGRRIRHSGWMPRAGQEAGPCCQHDTTRSRQVPAATAPPAPQEQPAPVATSPPRAYLTPAQACWRAPMALPRLLCELPLPPEALARLRGLGLDVHAVAHQHGDWDYATLGLPVPDALLCKRPPRNAIDLPGLRWVQIGTVGYETL